MSEAGTKSRPPPKIYEIKEEVIWKTLHLTNLDNLSISIAV